MKRIAAIAAALLVLLCLAFALWQFGQTHEAEAGRRAAMRDRDALAVRVTELEQDRDRLTAENASLRAAPPAAAAAGGPVVRTIQRAMPRGRMATGPLAALESPEARRLIAVDQKARLDSHYAALFGALRLPPHKLDQLKGLLVDKQNAPMDVIGAARDAEVLGEPGSGQAIRQMMGQESRAIDENIRELIGDVGYEEYQEYERTREERGVVEQLADRLSYGDSPLTPQQAENLVDLLAAGRSTQPPTTEPAQPAVRVAVMAGAGGGSDMVLAHSSAESRGAVVLSDQGVAAANTVLSPAQMEALREIQAAQQARAELGGLLRKSLPPLPAEGGAAAVRAGP